ncbi:DUF5703 domain-containing protein [Pontiella sulfatireligans]|uniref:DUF5703 domain-containing protein n=1 Tax=Pontiella sulfatireligans TaxID=2750658 RepID=UPI00109C17AE|nr:DUF5703 domain-containing protein [Pontiella sulfatireligans]
MIFIFVLCGSAWAGLDWLDDYTVVWDSQSANSSESMPCGGGDIGLNVWVEKGDLFFYVERSGNVDENDQLLKTGRVRIQIEPSPFAEDGKDIVFRQELDLKCGAVLISGETTDNTVNIKIWVEVHRPVIHVELDAEKESRITASFESWRNEKKLIPISDTGSGGGRDFNRWACYGYVSYKGEVFSYPDQVSFENKNRVLFYHRNGSDDLIDKEIALQRLDGVMDQMNQPTRNRIFGGVMFGDNLTAGDVTEGEYAFTPHKAWNLKSINPAKQHHVQIALYTEQTERLDQWKANLETVVGGSQASASAGAEAVVPLGSWNENLNWWSEFWNRSRVIINKGRGPEDVGWQVGRNYQLMRYMLACNAYGELPTNFNGGLFIYDHFYVSGRKGLDPSFYNADFRAWGAWTGMNQRLIYWPMLKSGDFEMMRPQFDFFRKNLRNAQLRNEVSFGIKGCSFAEQINTAGLPNGYHYGWEPPYGKRSPNHEMGMQHHHTHYFHTQLEFAYMMHEWRRFTGADISEYIPFMKDAVIFHYEYHKMLQRRRNGQDWDENGKLVLKGMQATETYKPGSNPMPEVAALHKNLEALLELPDEWVSVDEKAQFRDWAARVPELNFRIRNGHKTLSPLLEEKPSSRLCNRELAQLYPVFPYGIYALGQPDLEVGVNTWKYGLDTAGDTYLGKQFGVDGYPQKEAWWGWGQQVPMLARLGLTGEAKEYISKKLGHAMGDPQGKPKPNRFPAFWGPGYGCMPSMEWGAAGMIGLQEMLLQTIAKDGKEIRMLPAWPADWDVDFKLHAPEKTTVECRFENGQLVETAVAPARRKADVVIGQNQ